MPLNDVRNTPNCIIEEHVLLAGSPGDEQADTGGRDAGLPEVRRVLRQLGQDTRR